MKRIPMFAGGIERRKEKRRDAFEWRMLDTLRRDGKHALRRLAKDWQFSASAIVILELGIGANTAVFSILNNTLFQPHPFADSERLVNLYQNDAKTGEPEGVSYPAFPDLQKETWGTLSDHRCPRTAGQYPRGLFEYASANYLDVFGHAAVTGPMVQRRRRAHGRAGCRAGVDFLDA